MNSPLLPVRFQMRSSILSNDLQRQADISEQNTSEHLPNTSTSASKTAESKTFCPLRVASPVPSPKRTALCWSWCTVICTSERLGLWPTVQPFRDESCGFMLGMLANMIYFIQVRSLVETMCGLAACQSCCFEANPLMVKAFTGS